MKINFSY